MSLLAVWFPAVGTFGIVLAACGVIVSLLAFTGRKKVVLVSVSVLLGIGELVSINKAGDMHAVELNSQHLDAEHLEEHLKEQLRRSDTRYQVDTAVLQTKLDDYAALFRLVPAIMKLAETGAQSERRQYDTKVKSDRDLCELIMSAVKKLRDFSAIQGQIEEQQREQAVRIAHGQKTATELFTDNMNRSLLLSQARDREFLKSVFPDLAYARNELLKSRLKPPPLDPTDKAIIDAALTRGLLAGPNPELKVAAYLELWVKPIAETVSARGSNLKSKLSLP